MNTIASTLRHLVAATALLGLATLAAHAATATPPSDVLATVNSLGVDEPTAADTLSEDPLDLIARPVPSCRGRLC